MEEADGDYIEISPGTGKQSLCYAADLLPFWH